MARPLVACLSPLSFGFDPRSVSVSVVVDKVALAELCLRVIPFSPVSIIRPPLHTRIYPHMSHQEGERTKSGNLPKINVLSEIGEQWIESFSN